MTDPSNDLPWVNLGRWFAGELPAEEAASVARWVAGDPERAAVVAALREAWATTGAVGEGWDAAAALRRVREAAGEEATVIARLGAGRPAAPSQWRGWIRPALRAAAIIAVVGGGTLLITHPMGHRGPVNTVAAGAEEYRTGRGQRLTLRLTDGTQVVLAPGSVLRRPADYGRRTRRLELEGQAYFMVTHDAARPFSVHTNRFVARDLGTRFVIQAYSDEPGGEVFVAEGKVAVDRGTTALALLTHGQLAQVDSAGRLLVGANADPESHLAWLDGRLVFADTPLLEVQRQFERWYDVNVRLTSPALGRLHVSGVFGEQPVREELATVARALGLTVHSVEGGYELAPGRR